MQAAAGGPLTKWRSLVTKRPAGAARRLDEGEGQGLERAVGQLERGDGDLDGRQDAVAEREQHRLAVRQEEQGLVRRICTKVPRCCCGNGRPSPATGCCGLSGCRLRGEGGGAT